MKKRVFSLASSFLLLLGGIALVSCSGDDTSSSSTSSSESSSTTESESSSTTESESSSTTESKTTSESESSSESSSESESESQLESESESESSSSSSSSEEEPAPTPEEIVESLLSSNDITYRTLSSLGGDIMLSPTMEYHRDIYTTNIVKSTPSKYQIMVKGDAYHCVVPISFASDIGKTDQEIEEDFVSTSLPIFKNRSSDQLLEFNVDREHQVVELSFEAQEDYSVNQYIYFDDDVDQYYEFDANHPNDGSYVLDSEMAYEQSNYALDGFKDILIDALTNGSYDSGTSTYLLNKNIPWNYNGVMLTLTSIYVKLTDNYFISEIGYQAIGEDGSTSLDNFRMSTITTFSNVGSTSIEIPPHEKILCHHTYEDFKYDDLGDKCRKYCANCGLYIEDETDHIYMNDDLICMKCGHVKDGECIKVNSLTRFLFGSVVNPINKAEDDKLYAYAEKTSLNVYPMSPHEVYVDWYDVLDEYDNPIYEASLLYNSISKTLYYFASYPEDVHITNPCLYLSELTYAMFTDLELLSPDEELLRSLGEKSVDEIASLYPSATLVDNVTINRYEIVHDSSGSYDIETPIDDYHTHHEYICDTCEAHYGAEIQSGNHHEDYMPEVVRVAKPTGYTDPQADNYTYIEIVGDIEFTYIIKEGNIPIDHQYHYLEAYRYDKDLEVEESTPVRLMFNHTHNTFDTCAICGYEVLNDGVSDEYYIYTDKASLDFEHESNKVSVRHMYTTPYLKYSEFANNKYRYVFDEGYGVSFTKDGNTVNYSLTHFGSVVMEGSYSLE